jgi:DNA-binding NarL/FixJ family response regulator
VAVALLMSSTEDERVLAAVRAGVVGVLQKDVETAALIGSVQLLASGHAVLPTATIARLLVRSPPSVSAAPRRNDPRQADPAQRAFRRRGLGRLSPGPPTLGSS